LSQLIEKIAAEIRKQGAIPFVRFMELALYCPVYGYYEKEGDTIGRRGDFFTNVSVGTVFGEMLAARFAEWLESCPKSKVQSPKSGITRPKMRMNERATARLQIVEAGAHRGALAFDILNWLNSQRPGLLGGLEYWIVEPSARRQEWQQTTLAAFPNHVRWAKDLQQLGRAHETAAGIHGIIFCNELLDAMPARRLGWDALKQCWFEWGVTLDGTRFVWTRMPLPQEKEQTLLGEQAARLREVLPDGFTAEICPAATEWWRQAAECLTEGKLTAIDYGLTEEEFFKPERRDGTLRAYRGHRLSPDVLSDPGEQDITAHVNFGAIQRAGNLAGLSTDGVFYQSQFLTPLVDRVVGEWTPDRRRQFQTLTHPEHLGRAFRVLVQSRTPNVSS
jgi:SAM-dependent MidA family methyltransferase